MRSSIVGQRKPQAFKRKNKKHNSTRRYSEGESSDYESKPDAIAKTSERSPGNVSAAGAAKSKSQIQASNKHDSGVDFSEDGNDNTMEIRSNANVGRKDKKKEASVRKPSVDLDFKCGMIFDIEM